MYVYFFYIFIKHAPLQNSNTTCWDTFDRVIQEESAILWEMTVFVILSKKVQMNMGPILDGYGVMGIY